MRKFCGLISIMLLSGINMIFAQDKVKFIEYKPGFYQNNILKDVNEYQEQNKNTKSRKYLKADVSTLSFPNKIDQYKYYWHKQPISQGNAGTCWAFSTTSFYESEVYRLTKQDIKLSEIYTVYWEYVEKARRFVQERGNSEFSEGSEANAVTRMYEKYGIVPMDVYSGLQKNQKFHSHEKMYDEMNSYLNQLKINNAWSEEEAISTIKSIMNHYIGVPPVEFEFNGKKVTPKQFLQDVLKLNMEDYVDIISYIQEPYFEKVEYKVPDNWWHNNDYFNVPLDIFMESLNNLLKSGFTVSIDGDVSEAGFVSESQVAIVPSFDIPSKYIDENARQFRFSNKTTTDDHLMHLVGYTEKDGVYWYLVKDSSAGSRNNDEKSKEFGYYFFHQDYVKLKIMSYTVHKDAVKELK